ncbi:MAG: hypothetical protein KGJ02_06060 [Verrucomicrobiota bacterium]|nr:hypothetical protein [Verrucomicrobiota bacterium]
MRWLFLFFSVSAWAKLVVVCPPFISASPETLLYDPDSARDEIAKPFCALREALEKEGYEIKITTNEDPVEPCTAVLVFNESHMAHLLRSHPKERCFFFVLEPPFILPAAYDRQLKQVYGKIFVLFDHMIDNKNYFKFHYPQPRQKMFENTPSFRDKRLCTMIANYRPFNHPKALYRAREASIRFFGPTGDFDLYGGGWDPSTQAWRGKVPGKWEVLERYRFCLCYENMQNQEGYITEKIFDCFVAGCVPVYWGATNIDTYVPKECFIDRRAFKTNKELYAFLKNMDEPTYQTYIDAIRRYFDSPQAQLFSINHFVELIMNELRQL